MTGWLVIFGSTFVYQLAIGTIAARLVEPSALPRLALLWVCVLADRSPSTAARETDTWLSGFLGSAFLGYLLDVAVAAPRGVHMGVYGVCFVVVRLALNRLGQSRRIVQLVLLAGITLGVDMLLWWVKGMTLGFASFARLDLITILSRAVATGLVGALLFKPMAGLFAEREGGSLRRL